MSNKTLIIIGSVSLLVSFAFGRYLAPEKVRTEVKVVIQEKVVYTQSHAKTTIQKNKDGSSTTVIVTETNTKDKTNTASTDTTKETTTRGKLVNVSLLAGTNFAISNPSDVLVSTNVIPMYGLSVTVPVFGPVTFTGFGFSNLIFGGGVGISF